MDSQHFQPHFSSGINPGNIRPSENRYSAQSMDSRIADAHQHITYPGEVIATHVHPFHEIIYCITGSADYLLEDRQFHVSRGDIFFIPAGVTHTPLIPDRSGEAYRRYSLWFSQEFAQPLLAMLLVDDLSVFTQLGVLHTADSPWENTGDYFLRCVQECQQRQHRWEAAVFGIALELSVQLSRMIQGHELRTTEKSDLLGKVLEYLESHLADQVTAASIAARFWVSESTIRQLFRREVGMPLHRYVTTRRLSEAQVLIRSGVPMEQVSISVGFQDYSTFYRAFRSEFGISPAQYRKSNRD